MYKFIILSAVLAVINAEFLHGQHSVDAPSPSVSSHSSNTLRNSGNIAQVSTHSKTIETPYSSQSKSNVHINNPGVYAHENPVIYSSGISSTGFGRTNVPAYPSASTVSHATYNTGSVAYATAPTLGQQNVATFGPSCSTDHAIGSSHESTVKSLDGNHAVTHYSKAVDTAFSSVRKSDTRLTNEAKLISVAPTLTYASAAYATPLVAKAAFTQQVNPAVSYSSAPVVAHATFAGLGAQYNW